MSCINNCNNHNCSRCGSCCALGVPITKEEENIIREYIKKNNIEPEILIKNNNFYLSCCFFDRKNHKCKIYPVRPSICKTFKCDRNKKKLEKEKRENHRKAYWNHWENGKLSNITTFDLLFYDNPEPLLQYLFRTISGENDENKFNKIKEILIKYGQSELANCLVPIYGDEKND